MVDTETHDRNTNMILWRPYSKWRSSIFPNRPNRAGRFQINWLNFTFPFSLSRSNIFLWNSYETYLNLVAIVKQSISQIMQMREIDSQVRHLQHVLDVLSVRIFDIHVRWQHSENDFTIFGWFNARVSMIAHNVRYIFRYQRYARKWFLTIVRKVFVHLPRFTKIVRPFD